MLRFVAELLVTNLVELVMLSVGLRSRPGQVLAEVRRPALLIRELLLLALGVPLLTLLVVRVLTFPPRTAVIVILFAICPAAPFLLHGFQRRETAASKALAVVAVALAASVFIVPAWILLLNHFSELDLRVSASTIFTMLAVKAFVPLFLGMLVRRTVPSVAAVVDRVVSVAIILALIVATILLIHLGWGKLRFITVPIALALLLIPTGCAILGEWAGGQDLELREILGSAAMNGNPALALAVIGTSYPTLDMGGLVAAYLICRAFATLPYKLLAKRRARRRQHASQAA